MPAGSSKTIISRAQVDRILTTKGEMTPNEMKIIDAYIEQLGFVNTTAEKLGPPQFVYSMRVVKF